MDLVYRGFWNLFANKRDKGTQNLCFSKEI